MSIDLIKKALATGGEHLGDLIFWSLSDARIDRTNLESVWAGAGLDPELLPDAPTAEKVLKIAVREAQVGNLDRLIRLAKEDESELVYAVVREQRPGDGNLDYHQEARIALDRQREMFSSDRPGHDLVATVKSRFEMYRTTHHPDDVRRAIVKTLNSLAAVTLRDGGGIYWVPSPFAEKLRRLQSAIEKIGASRVYLLPVHKSAEAEQTLGEIAKGSIEEELAALQSEISTFLHTPPERASTLMRRFDAFEALRNRAKLYRDVLHVQVEDLDQQLNKLSGAVEDMLAQKAA
jgi:hypothetical protein